MCLLYEDIKFQSTTTPLNPIVEGSIVGFFSGLAVAIGGAIKDAPYEGFDMLKFFRSPTVALVEGAAQKAFIPDLNDTILFFSTIGTERLTVETYKVLRAHMPMKFHYGEWGIPKGVLPTSKLKER
jgi:hypothetical protein